MMKVVKYTPSWYELLTQILHSSNLCTVRRYSSCFRRYHPPLDNGERSRMETLPAPALSPKMVTLLGLPWKAAMLSLTHWSAMIWSSRP